METVFFWLHIFFSYIATGGLLLYTFVIENILNDEVTLIAKLGATGIFILAICLVIGVVIINKLFAKREEKFEKLSIKEIDTNKRAEYILKWESTEKWHNIFKQCLMLGVLVMLTLLVGLLETKLLAFRGTMTTITISYAIGLVFFGIYENYKLKKLRGNKKVED